ncbi:hypothetical protein [Hydrogenobacter thermophilus]|uniref:O-antigen polymerase n=2 Tax=Hydrogenobacter thermophilus TaxID=940 RepID=D3DKI8_HYDTT|nr:hypothetical protein [Hydrogenobacter thermophilus]BAI70340.1 hypothetical protein HTH_1896 [Hydrogenobacter thermophilus TK-6]
MSDRTNLIVFLLTLSAFVSITLFEAFLAMILLYCTFYLFKRREMPKGILTKPLVIYAIPTLLSAILYTPQYINKGIERSLFLFAYPVGSYVKMNQDFLYKMNKVLLLVGYVLMPVVIYKFYKTGEPAPLWGGWFEVGIFYSIFSLVALALFVKDRNYLYLVSFFIFVSFVFLSARRSSLLALGATLLIFFFLMRRHIPIRYITAISLLLLLVGGFSSYLLVKKDERFGTLYQVITRQKPINDETLNKISSLRWKNLKAGVEVIKKDISQGNYLQLLIGHGVNPGYHLEPKSPIGGAYESVMFLSEFIQSGALGLIGIMLLYVKYYTFVLRFPLDKENVLFAPFLLTLSILFVGAIFTGFWDALLPLYLIWFKITEEHRA